MHKAYWMRALTLAVVVAAGFLFVSGASAAVRRTLTVGLNCYSLGHQRLQCEADVAGGTGSYSYQWTPTPTAGGGQLAIIHCARAYQYQSVSVSVTDNGNSSTAGDSGSFYCGDAQ